MNLASGQHSLRVIKRSPNGTLLIINGFRVYSGIDFDPKGIYTLVNRATGNPLTIRDGVLSSERITANGAAPHWRLEAVGTGCYQIISNNGNRTLGNSVLDGKAALLNLSTDGDAPTSFWKTSPVGTADFRSQIVRLAWPLSRGSLAPQKQTSPASLPRQKSSEVGGCEGAIEPVCKARD